MSDYGPAFAASVGDGLTIPVLTFLLGGILVLVSILGGGFEVRELKIPQVNWFTRLVAAAAGSLFILIALGLYDHRPLLPGPEFDSPKPPPDQRYGSERERDAMGSKYEGKYGAYSAVVPKDWKLVETEFSMEDAPSYKVIAMFSPGRAARAEVNGRLSEGIRIELWIAAEGRVWTNATAAEYAPEFARTLLAANKGFVQTSSAEATIGEESVRVLEMVGQRRNSPEPEKVRYYVLAREQCRVTIECVAPASRFGAHEAAFDRVLRNFEMKRCPVWKAP